MTKTTLVISFKIIFQKILGLDFLDPANILLIVDTIEVKTRPIKSFGRLVRARAPLRLNFSDQTIIHV